MNTNEELNVRKTADDYRRDIKILKVKYIRLLEEHAVCKETIERQANKLRLFEQHEYSRISSNIDDEIIAIAPSDSRMSILSDAQIMELFAKNC